MTRRAVLAVLAAAIALPVLAQTPNPEIRPSARPDEVEGVITGEEAFTLTPELDLELDLDLDLEENADGTLGVVEDVEGAEAAPAAGAVLRALDKLSGETRDLRLGNAETAAFGRMQVTLGECRHPAGNPAGDAYAWLVIRPGSAEPPVFEGWMIASSPALNALDHSRYDVWVLRCITS